MSDSDKDRWDDDFNRHQAQEREEAESRGETPESIEDQINEIPDEDWDGPEEEGGGEEE